MKKILIVLVFGLSLLGQNVNAQSPAGGMTPPDFKAEKAAGIFTYELDEVISKLKIKEEERKNKVAEALKVYNTKMDALSLEHTLTFRELEDAFNKNIQIAIQNRDRSQMNGVRAEIQKVIPPIREQVMEEEKVLNNAMVEVLTEKQNDKWLKYQKRKKGDTGNFQ